MWMSAVPCVTRTAPLLARKPFNCPLRAAGQASRHPPVRSKKPFGSEAEPPAGADVTLAISRPSPGETVWGEGGVLEVALATGGLPRAGGRVVLELDGAEAAWEGELPVLRLSQVWRGEHRLRARLVGPKGRTLALSEEVRFYKRQPSAIRAAPGPPGGEGVPPSSTARRPRSRG